MDRNCRIVASAKMTPGGGHVESVCSALLASILLAIGAAPLSAGLGVVTVNQHQTIEDATCDHSAASNPPWNWGLCSNNEPLPFPVIAQSSTPVEAFSYHVRAYQGNSPKRGHFCQAICDYQFAGRPKIISSDYGAASTASVRDWLRVICHDATRQSGSFRGRLHFEHWENYLTDVAMAGGCLGGYNYWGDGTNEGQEIIDVFSESMRDCASVLSPNGQIYRPVGNDRLRWSTSKGNDNLVTLVGFGHMGAVTMGDRLLLPNYTRDLRWKRANLTRVWGVEQWSAQADNVCTSGEGPTPFVGELAPNGYNLQQPNHDFYEYLRRFVQSGADHGIVIQLSVFDKHGIVNTNCPRGDFSESPYNQANNNDALNRFPAPPPCTVSCLQDSLRVEELGGDCEPPPTFIDPGPNVDFHFPYLARVARETGAIGNVMYEVINEAMPENWTGGEQWQIDMAQFLKQNLPVSVVRDAFNEYADGSLAGKSPDARQSGSDSWTATNATVDYEIELHTELKMGKVVPSSGAPMTGSLPFLQPALWTDLGVRATVTAASTRVRLGIATSAGHHVRLEVVGPENKLRLIKVGSGGELAEVLLGEAPLAGAATSKTIRLRILKNAQGDLSAEALVNGSVVPGLSLPIGEISGAFSAAFFATNATLGASPSVDNLEAAYFCDSPTLCGSSSEEM